MITLIRHGEVAPLFDQQGRHLFYGTNQPLGDTGYRQLSILGKTLNRDNPPAIIFTSPTLRAMQSARKLQEELANKPSIIVVEGLRASSVPQWEDKPIEDLIHANGDTFAKNPHFPDLYGETLDEVYKRATETFTDIKHNLADFPIALVTHGEIIAMIQHHLKYGENAEPGMESLINKGEAVSLKFSPDGKLLESQLIAPERIFIKKEKET